MKIGNMYFFEKLDADGDLPVRLRALGYEEMSWIDKAEAVALIAHLQKLFGLVE